MSNHRKKNTIIKLSVFLGLLLGAVYAGFPVVWMVFSSFKSNFDIFAYPPRIFAKTYTLEAYQEIITNPLKLRFFFNSYLVSSVVTVLTIFVAILAAYSFSRFNFKLKKTASSIIISIQAIPAIVLLIPFFSLIVASGLYNTYWALILTYMVFTLPYAIIMMTGYFNTLSIELDYAAKIDGANHFTVLWKILFPIALPGVASIAIYTFMQAWNEYLFALTLMRTNEMKTVPVGIALLMGQHDYRWNQMMAMSIFGCAPVLLLFLFFQRYFISGMTTGAVKF